MQSRLAFACLAVIYSQLPCPRRLPVTAHCAVLPRVALKLCTEVRLLLQTLFSVSTGRSAALSRAVSNITHELLNNFLSVIQVSDDWQSSVASDISDDELSKSSSTMFESSLSSLGSFMVSKIFKTFAPSIRLAAILQVARRCYSIADNC